MRLLAFPYLRLFGETETELSKPNQPTIYDNPSEVYCMSQGVMLHQMHQCSNLIIAILVQNLGLDDDFLVVVLRHHLIGRNGLLLFSTALLGHRLLGIIASLALAPTFLGWRGRSGRCSGGRSSVARLYSINFTTQSNLQLVDLLGAATRGAACGDGGILKKK